ncbi:hypothetical protein HNQ77_004830 [Silvibacterium bohemicum]|uniref:Uncharacterized protein n=1 Tax=Silvibacterium bohemicum TaxID=1577686 RepID=A0A841K4I0_9BACT|nr:hypothetical protein [Silvibacterium bohemicum]MBB6146849.1 hypothetical protein [Silvibacterium bohemicum]
MKKSILAALLLIALPLHAQTVAIGTSSSAANPQRSGQAGTGLFSSTSDAVSVSAGGIEIMRVNGNGVGIGTASPVTELDVYSTGPTTGIRNVDTQALGTTSGGAFLAVASAIPAASGQRVGSFIFGAYNGTSAYYPAVITGWASEAWSSTDEGSYIQFETTATGTNSRTAKMLINPSGDVGIGTTTPVNLLDVDGGVAIGTSYAGADTAPINGLIVQGDVGIGTSSPNLPLEVTTNTTALPAPNFSSQIQIGGPDGSFASVDMDAFQNSSSGVGTAIFGRIYGGTNASRTTASGNILGLCGQAYNGTGFPTANSVCIGEATDGTQTTTSAPTSITFGTTPSGSTTRAVVMEINNAGNVGIGTTAPAVSLDLSSRTDAISLPPGTTGQRPGTGVAGMLRYNSTNGIPEFYTSSWLPVPLTASSPIVINSSTGNITCPTCGISSGRTRLMANQTFYISTTGNDGNNCLTVGTACATLNNVWNLIANNYDLAGYTATIQLADGTYTSGLAAELPTTTGPIVINGDSTTPSNVVISVTGENAITGAGAGVSFTIQNLEMTASGSENNDLTAQESAVITMGPGLVFGAVDATSGGQIVAQTQGSIIVSDSYSIVGGGGFHYYAADGSLIRVVSTTITATITGTPAFGQQFASSIQASQIILIGLGYSGSATGSRYTAVLNGIIDTNTGNTSYLPGNAAGTTSLGGQYD